MSNKALVKLVKYPLYWKELQSLPAEQTAYFSLVCFAATELNALSRVFVQSAHEPSEDHEVNIATITQQLTLLRVWSAKLFELSKSIRRIHGSAVKDECVKSLVKDATNSFKALEAHPGFKSAENVRNEATNHYDFKAAKQNIKHVSPRAECSLYLHEVDANSFYPLGDEVMFTGGLNRPEPVVSDDGSNSTAFQNWHEWNLIASDWARGIHLAAFKKIVMAAYPDRAGQMRVHWPDAGLVATTRDPKAALFLRRDR